MEEPSYFFDLSRWQEPLLKYYEEHPDFIAPSARRNEVMSFVKSGLRDLSVSRTSFKWGIPVPDDDSHIMYVWLDALTNYITAAGYPNTDSEDFTKILASRSAYGRQGHPAFSRCLLVALSMAAELPLPKRIFAHGWWMNEGQKMSKSLGNFINPYDLIDKYGLDQVRYFCLRRCRSAATESLLISPS